MFMNRIFLFPCNGNTIEAIECIDDRYEIAGFIDDSVSKQGSLIFGYSVFAREVMENATDAKVLAVPGRPENFLQRKSIIDNLGIPVHRYTNVQHRSAVVSKLAKVGFNTLIMAGVVVTGNAIIGNHVCILPNTVIHHDVVIGDYTLIGSNVTIAGYVKIGEIAYIGSGSTLKNDVSVGDRTLIGLSSNVVQSIPSDCVAFGNPATVNGR